MPDNYRNTRRKLKILLASADEKTISSLSPLLQETYDLLIAGDVNETFAIIEKYPDTLSVVLCDLGEDNNYVLRKIVSDEKLSNLPLIAMSDKPDDEENLLEWGAFDFILKPYIYPRVVLLRTKVCIEFSEVQETIRSAERDNLTNLYNREYFYHYVRRFDTRYKDIDMDAIVLSLDHFSLFSERFGKNHADAVLRSVASTIKKMAIDSGGIVCREMTDTFLLYLPHGQIYDILLEQIYNGLKDVEANTPHVRLRMGVYELADKKLEVEDRFSRAKLAAESIINSYTKIIAVYDEQLHDSQMFNARLIEDFSQSLADECFEVYYQPKFNIQTVEPSLYSCEALVRWNHPELGMIRPDFFIKLFEENGLITQLDEYVWRKTAAQIRVWKEKYSYTIPVSVNVSRIDLMDLDFFKVIDEIVTDNGLNPQDLYLEITESAYSQNTAFIIDKIKQLRKLGYRISMDDFGTGYSSLGLLMDLPIDSLKLDRLFVRYTESDDRYKRMLRLIIDIGDYLDAVVIAEGVESKEQLEILKSMGCDLVQGYYFSMPVTAEEFELHIRKRLEQLKRESEGSKRQDLISSNINVNSKLINERISRSLAMFYSGIYYSDFDTGQFVEYRYDQNYTYLKAIQGGDDFLDYCKQRTVEYVLKEEMDDVLKIWDHDYLEKALAGNTPLIVKYHTDFSGTVKEIEVRFIPLFEKDSRHLIVTMNNVDDQIIGQIKEEIELYESQGYEENDELTGALTRLALINKEISINRSIKNNEYLRFALMTIDIDGLRNLNQQEGREAGDELLKLVVGYLQSLYGADHVYRVGGDEFVIFIEGDIYLKREELFNRLHKANLERKEQGLTIFVAGMADYEKPDEFREVLRRAEKRMYEYKWKIRK